ncbi:MAG: energy transducer TonB [Gammaproteobacteria bacterium]|nr:energy transducer TonB [Gammaproteobacteria bacterium]
MNRSRTGGRPGIGAGVAVALAAVIVLTAAGCAGASRPLQLLSGADLVYPDQARAAGVEGVVRVRYDVTVEGRVVNARVDAADPVGVFDEAALAFVRSWRFQPAVEDGEFVAALARVSEVRFQLGDTDRYDRPVAVPE